MLQTQNERQTQWFHVRRVSYYQRENLNNICEELVNKKSVSCKTFNCEIIICDTLVTEANVWIENVLHNTKQNYFWNHLNTTIVF